MDFIAVGIDVSKDRLDIAVRPGGEAFTVERNAAVVEQLAERLRCFRRMSFAVSTLL